MKHVAFPPVVNLLLDGRERVERGWVQRCTRGPHEDCAITALARTLPFDRQTYHKACAYLKEAVGGPVVRWNDTPGRTKADVLAAYDRAIRRALEDA